ncbi:CBS and ACT domain-containing protein [Alkalicoccus chagannorensis]|uniref:CBS and ACT domain-containing protein n=1 Tax=Alkalicoccus chagannorensis TaxID=427072 RepID=UPI00041AFF40|nr:CBS and ACT domain-containing protein [Alkalicoccus chagannorensis]
MKVEEVMNTEIHSVTPGTTLHEAAAAMETHHIRHLPVIEEESGALLGILSDRDITSAPEGAKTVTDRMTAPVHTAFTGDFVEEAANRMLENKIHCLPVLGTDQVVGMLTDSDLLQTLVHLTGSNAPSSRVEVLIPDKTGELHEVTGIAAELGLDTRSMFILPDDDNGMRVVIRLQTMRPDTFVKKLLERGYHVLWPVPLGMS